MQYTITVNQFAFCKYFPLLNISHAAIVDWFTRFTHSSKISRLEHKGKIYYWLQYDKAREELPILGISSKDSMRRLIKALCNENILEAHPHNQAMGRSYFAFGDRYEFTHTSANDLVPQSTGGCEKNQGSYRKERGGRTEKNEGVVQKCTTDPYIHDHDSRDQKDLGSGNPDFSLSEISNSQNSENLSNQDLDPNLIPEQQEKNQSNPEKKESSAKERKGGADFAPQPPENTPLSRNGGLWDINYLNKVWRDNKAEKWKVSSLMFLNSEIQYGLEQFLQRAGDDRAEAYRLIGISIAEMANTDFYRNKSMMINTLLAADPSKPCAAYCGNFLGAAIEREERALEKAQKPETVERSPLPLPTAADNVFFTQIKGLL